MAMEDSGNDAARRGTGKVDFFRLCIRYEMPEASEEEIDAAVAASREELPPGELADKLKERVLDRLQGDSRPTEGT
jgi:hypothetical protein